MTGVVAGDPAATLAEAVSHHNQGRIHDAAQLYAQLIGRDPNHFDALHLLGVAKLQTGDILGAIGLIDRALDVNGANPVALNNAGVALTMGGRPTDAIARLDRALIHKPGYAEAHFNRANAYRALAQLDRALVDFDAAVALRADYVDAHINRALTLEHLNRLDDAISALDRAVTVAPRHAGAHYNRALMLRHVGRWDDAVPGFAAAADLAPPHPEARVALAETLMALGKFEAAWPLYEWRWQTAAVAPRRRQFEQPEWRGDTSLAGKTILVHAEQGFGDTLMFGRFVPRLCSMAERVIFAVQPELLALLSRRTDGVVVVDVTAPGPTFDVHCPIASLPAALRSPATTVAHIGSGLTPDPDRVALWRDRLAKSQRPLIGLAWSTPRSTGDSAARDRSMIFAALAPLATCQASFVILQPNRTDDDRAAFAHFAALTDAAAQFRSFDDTAAAVAALDLVVTVDTAVAHVAGNLGKPLWMMLPYAGDWRWATPGGVNAWYPRARLFRQPRPGDWQTVTSAVAAALRENVTPAS